MKSYIALIFAVLFSGFAGAQPAHVHGGQPTVPFQTPDVNMPATKIYINTTTIPKRKTGTSQATYYTSCGPLSAITQHIDHGFYVVDECSASLQVNIGYGPGDFAGGFRTKCNISHWSFDDPIVKPGQAGMTHLHQFFGNTTTDSQSDASKMKDIGDSTCAGGVLNRTGYWVPVLVYHCPVIEVGCDRNRDGTVYPAYGNLPYYKLENMALRWNEAAAGSTGNAQRAAAIAQERAIKWWPVGFRMIQGDPNNLVPERFPGRFDCSGVSGDQQGTYNFIHFPNSAQAAAANNGLGCVDINMLIWFPTCRHSDETILYQASPVGAIGSGHVNAGGGGLDGQLMSYRGCPNAPWTIPTPELTYNIHTKQPTNADWDYMVLSSDNPARALVVLAGSTTTQIKLPATEQTGASTYVDGAIMWNGQRRYIVAYDGTTKTATVSPAFSTAPPTGATVGVRYPGGLSAHGDWANGWSDSTTVPGFFGFSITDQIIRNCYRDEVRYGTLPNSAHLNCEVNNIGDLSPSTNLWPRVGGTQTFLPLP